MALNDTAFKTEIIALQDEMMEAVDYETAKVMYAEKLLLAIKNYIISATVTVTTTGTATNHTGTGTIS